MREQGTGVGALGHRIAEAGRQAVQDRSPAKKPQLPGSQPVQHLGAQILGDRRSELVALPDREGGERESGRPALRLPDQQVDLLAVQGEPRRVEEGRGLWVRHGQVVRSETEQVALHAPARERQSRVGSTEERDLTAGGQVIDKGGDQRQGPGGAQQMEVIEDQDERPDPAVGRLRQARG